MRSSFAVIATLIIGFVGCKSTFAAESFFLAYFADIKIEGSSFVLQEHGRKFSAEEPIVIPIGLGGRGKFEIRLVSFANSAGKLIVEVYGDENTQLAATTPIYSFTEDFELGSLAEVKRVEEGIVIEFAFTMVER